MTQNDVVGLLATQKDAERADVVEHGTFHDGRGVHEECGELFLDGEMQVVEGRVVRDLDSISKLLGVAGENNVLQSGLRRCRCSDQGRRRVFGVSGPFQGIARPCLRGEQCTGHMSRAQKPLDLERDIGRLG